MKLFSLLAVLATSASAGHVAPLATAPSASMQLLKESLRDQAPLLTSIRAEERKAKSSNLRASTQKDMEKYIADDDDPADDVADSEDAEFVEATEAAEAEALAAAGATDAHVDAAIAGKEDVVPVNDTASAFERDVTDLILGMGTAGAKGGAAATPMGDSVRKMKELITKVMLSKVREAHKADQSMLNRLAKSVGACGQTKGKQLMTASLKESLYKSRSPLHKSCRNMEASYATEKKSCEVSKKQALTMAKLTCKSFKQIESTISSQVTNTQMVKKANSEASETYVRRLTATVCGTGGKGNGGSGEGGYLDRFLSSKEACKKNTKDYDDKVEQCKSLSEKYALKKTECDSMQAQMDNAACKWAVETKDACENYVGCYNSKKKSYSTTEKVVRENEKDRKAEYRGLKRMQCLIAAFKDARVTNSEVNNCKSMAHDTSAFNIDYPTVGDLESCAVPNLYPATSAYKRLEFAPLPVLARGEADANECTGVEEVSTKPRSGSPDGCKCERMAVQGTYSAGPLIKCTNCLDVSRSTERNSCPRATKLFSPRTPADWQTVMDSGGELRGPHFIVDVTRPENRCKGCSRKGMNSRSPAIQENGWETDDDSPWWITRKRGGMDMDKDPNIGMGYAANCYLNIASTSNVNKIKFNAGFCNYHSHSYYCQPVAVSTRPKRGSPKECRCSSLALTGKYSAGSLIKCESCLEVSKSLDKNSCPKGTKIFSPASRRDWKVVLDSAGPLRNPDWIIDITRPNNGCGGCTKNPMQSSNPAQATWRTADGSPWWLRSSSYSEPNGDYTANCYMAISGTPANENDIRINDGSCKYKSSSYYCQPAQKPE